MYRFGTFFAHKIRKRRSEVMRLGLQWRWHLDEVFVKPIQGKRALVQRALNWQSLLAPPEALPCIKSSEILTVIYENNEHVDFQI